MPRRTPRQYAVTLAGPVALGLVVLTGCTGDPPEPDPLDSASSEAPSQSAEPSPSSRASSTKGPATTDDPPVLPAAARGTTRASAGPFVRHWVDTFNYATQQLDAAALIHISTGTCEACVEITRIIRRIERGDGYMHGASWRLRRTHLLPLSRPAHPQVRAYITFAPSVVLEQRGAKPKRYKGGRRTVYTFDLTRRQEMWTVSGIVGVSA